MNAAKLTPQAIAAKEKRAAKAAAVAQALLASMKLNVQPA